MKIAVVGAGAMGSVYAALLAEGGNAVSVVDVDEEHVEAIRADGLRVTGASGDLTVAIDANTRPAEIGVVDLVVIATKSMDVAAAARSAAPLIDEATTVLTIQNGLGAADVVAGIVPPEAARWSASTGGCGAAGKRTH